MDSRAEQDLALIRRLMEDSRREVTDRGKHFLIWGCLSVVGLAYTYLAATGAAGLDPAWVWLGILAIGWAASLAVGFRDGRRARVVTLGRRLLTGTWVSAAVTLTLVALAGLFGDVVSSRALAGLISVIIAVPVLLTGLLTGEGWLRWVAGGWWAGGLVMLFVPGVYALLVMAGMALLLMALPGAVLHARSRRALPAPEPVGDAG